MSLGPLVPRSDIPRGSEGTRDLQPPAAEFLRPISALYNALPSQESTLREYMRVLIKRKWMVIAVIVAIFMVSGACQPAPDSYLRRSGPHCRQ
jgi:hypothetical protein